ncbi:MAG: integration host factor subunit beta [Deltaproteobacteria bacterium]|nr:integration host factor subunit beta [Deltaproteobacteria bacterium]
MTKSELIEVVAAKAPNFPKRDVEIIVNTMFDTMTVALQQHERIEIRGFGSFVARERRARDGRNPRTGEKVSVPHKWVPFFTAGKELRERVDNSSHPLAKDTDDDSDEIQAAPRPAAPAISAAPGEAKG